MKVLLDACAWPVDPGDEEILARADSEGRVLVTLDKDFGEIAIVRGRPHSGILRLVGIRARQQGEAILAVLDRFGPDLTAGGIVTAESGRVRIRVPQSNT